MIGSVNIKHLIAKAVENTFALIQQHPADIVALVTYTSDSDFKQAVPHEYQVLKSAKAHLIILKQVQKRVAKKLGKKVVLVPFNQKDYTQWLLSHKLENNQSNRGAWAASKAQNFNA